MAYVNVHKIDDVEIVHHIVMEVVKDNTRL